MRRLIIVVSSAAILTTLPMAGPSYAIGPTPQGVQAAIDELSLIDAVHCRPGLWHHLRRPHDGCPRIIIRGGGYREGVRFREREREGGEVRVREREREGGQVRVREREGGGQTRDGNRNPRGNRDGSQQPGEKKQDGQQGGNPPK